MKCEVLQNDLWASLDPVCGLIISFYIPSRALSWSKCLTLTKYHSSSRPSVRPLPIFWHWPIVTRLGIFLLCWIQSPYPAAKCARTDHLLLVLSVTNIVRICSQWCPKQRFFGRIDIRHKSDTMCKKFEKVLNWCLNNRIIADWWKSTGSRLKF